ncbi:hypothetical protein SAMN05661096_01595 [Marivirga sericea]|uniref:Uncharacterized protein n=1 Tax=Marivirga sericea TaxID=1028 RepID=A0A1X7JGX4_9BACT|nr:hypothetical protein SAMN05661096_01595 [Marivirga sericea]
MIDLSIKKFLKILFGFVGIAYLLTIIYSITSNLQASFTAYEWGREIGYSIGFVTGYLLIITLVLAAFFTLNLIVNKFRLSK